MRVIEVGHLYAVRNVDGDGEQTIRFVRRRGDDARPTNGRQKGILGQEFDPCADRPHALPQRRGAVRRGRTRITEKLRDCLRLYESRAARRTIERLPMPERADVCPVCHHLVCDHRHPQRLEQGSGR